MASEGTAAVSFSSVADPGLPEGWELASFDDVVVETTAGDWGNGQSSGEVVAAKILRGTDFARAGRGLLDAAPVRYLMPASVQKRQLAPGELLVELSGGSKDQPTGRILLVSVSLLGGEFPVAFSNFVKRLRLDGERVDPEFATYFWSNLYRQGKTRPYEKRTTGIRNFRLADFLANERILLPPIPEQQAIVGVLRVLEQAKHATEGVVTAARELKRSLTRHLFTYGPVPVATAEDVELQETEFGSVPARWEMKTLGAMVRLQRGFDITKKEQTPGPYAVISSSGPSSYHNAYKAEGPGVIIGRKGSVGTVHYSDKPYWPHDTTLWVTDFLGNEPKWTYYLLHNLNLKRYDVGASNPTLNRNHIYPLSAPSPPVDEQRTTVQILKAVETKIEAEEARLYALERVFDALLPGLVTGTRRIALEAVRG